MVAQIDAGYVRSRPGKLWSRLVSYALFEGRPLTTRGRWINPVVFGIYGLARRLPQLRRVFEPVFILGMGRSGTTVLGIVMSMHRDVGFLNEPKALWHALHPEDDLIGSYSRGNARYRLTEFDATSRRKMHANRFYGAYLTATFSRRVVDKYPELIFRVPYVRTLFPNAKFIFLMRDGWDTCRSVEGWSDRLGIEMPGEVHDWWGVDRRKWHYLVEQLLPEHSDLAPNQGEIAAFTRQSDMAAVEWILTMREGLRCVREAPAQVYGLKFENLCADPEGELERVRDFLGLPEDPVFTQYGRDTLRPVAASEPFDLHPVLAGPFLETRALLGYPVHEVEF